MDFLVTPGGSLHGLIEVPGDKSISHRALILGALAEGESVITNILAADDIRATAGALKSLGVKIGGMDSECRVHGVGLAGLTKPHNPIDLGNSGTALRLLSGVIAGQSFSVTLTGDSSLRRRPMDRIKEPLALMGADIEASDGVCVPLQISGKRRLTGIEYSLPIASAQIKSAVLLAGLYAKDITTVREKLKTRDHTERMLAGFGCAVEISETSVTVTGGGRLQGRSLSIPGDFSSAAFFLVAALITPSSEITLSGVGVNPTRTGALEVLRRMGATIEVNNSREIAGEPVADVKVISSTLHGFAIPPELVVSSIDEFPALAVAAACAQGTTSISGAAELRVKESDRIKSIVAGLRALGIVVEEFPDGMTIHGGQFRGGIVESHGDHRIAMAFAVAGAVSSAPVRIMNCDLVQTSFPGFSNVAQMAGLQLVVNGGES